MRKKITTIGLLFLASLGMAQVGIGTTTPAATLDVVGEPSVTTVFDGIIAPRLTAAQLSAKTYTTAQNGTMVYVTDNITGTAQASDVNGSGLYVFNALQSKWVKPVNATASNGLTATAGNIELGGTSLNKNTTINQDAFNLTFGSTTGNLLFNPSGTGKVGIGTNNPQANLEVAGTTRLSNYKNAQILTTNANGDIVAGTLAAATTVSNTPNNPANTISTTVNGVTGTPVTVPNLYSADGTISAARTVTLAANKLKFTSTIVDGFNVSDNLTNPIFSVDGANKFVGIGTATPAYKFDVNNPANNTGVSSPTARFLSAGTSNSMYITASAGGTLVMGVNSGAAIGDLTASSRYFGFPGATGADIQLVAGLTAASPKALLTAKDNGNVGIGTVTPTAKLDVVSATARSGFRLADTTQAAGNILVSDANGNASWATKSNVITASNGLSASNGNVILGGTGSDLTQNTSINLTRNNFTLKNGSTNAGSYNFGSAIGDSSYLAINNPSNQSGLQLTSGSTTTTLYIIPNSYTLLRADNQSLTISTFAAFPIQFATSNATRMTVDATGNVGVGTITPTNLLDVNGTAGKPGGGAWATLSDARVKKDIHSFNDGLAVLMNLKPKSFKYNEKSGYADTNKEYIGFIAQEVEQVAPYMVSKMDDSKGASGLSDKRQFDESALSKIIVNAIQELSNKNEALSNKRIRRRNKIIETKIVYIQCF